MNESPLIAFVFKDVCFDWNVKAKIKVMNLSHSLQGFRDKSIKLQKSDFQHRAFGVVQ